MSSIHVPQGLKYAFGSSNQNLTGHWKQQPDSNRITLTDDNKVDEYLYKVSNKDITATSFIKPR